MAITPVWLTGFEYGVATPVTNGGGLADTVSGTIVIQSTIHRTADSYSAEFSPGAYLQKTLTAAGYQVGSIYVYFKTALPTANAFVIYGINTDGNMVIYFRSSDSKLCAGKSGAGGDIAGPTVTYNTWYRIDYRFFTAGTTHTTDWKVDGNDQSQFSIGTRTNVNMTAVRIGNGGGGTNNIIIDDVIISSTTGDYPIGDHAIIGLSPNVDGTHSSFANCVEDETGADIVTPGYTTAYTLLNSVPIGDATHYVKQSATQVNAYAVVGFANITQSNILGVGALLAYKSSGTSSNYGSAKILDGATASFLIAGDMSESSNFYKFVVVTPASGWSQSAVNGLTGDIGHSSDASPNPYWLDLILEVAYAPVTGYTLQCTTGTFVESGQNAVMLWGHAVLAAAGSFTWSRLNAILVKSYPLKTTTGAFSLASGGAIELWAHKILAAAGGYTWTRNSAIEFWAHKTFTTTGSYALSGKNAILVHGYKLLTTTGSYAWTGMNAILSYTSVGHYYLYTTAGVFQLTGQNAVELWLHKTLAAAGNFSLAGQNARLLAGRKAFGATGIFSLSGQNAVLKYGRAIRTSTGVFTESGQNAVLKYNRVVLTTAGVFVWTGLNAILTKSTPGAYFLWCSTGIFSLTGNNATELWKHRMLITTGSYSLAGQNAQVSYGRNVRAATGSYAWTRNNALLGYGRRILANPGAYNLTGSQALLLVKHLLKANQGAFAWTGWNAILSQRGAVVALIALTLWSRSMQMNLEERNLELVLRQRGLELELEERDLELELRQRSIELSVEEERL